MKNSKIYKLMSALLLNVLLFTSCTNNESVDISSAILDKNSIENAPLEMQIKYANKHLLDIGKIITKLAHNRAFKSILYNKINERAKNGSDNAVLVKDLISEINTKNKSFIISDNDKASLQKSLEAFYNLDGQDWYPEIVITNFEEKYQKFLVSPNNKTYDASRPLIVPVVYEDDDESTEDAYMAYQEQNDGTLTATNIMITQSNAATRDVLFIKIAETCGVQNQQVNGEPFFIDCSSGGSTGGGQTVSPIFILNQMTGKQHKEAVGRSEILVRTQGRRITGHFPLTVANVDLTSRGVEFKYKRKWIRRKTPITHNERYIFAEPIPQGIFYDVLVFEWDAWPAPNHIQTFNLPLGNGEFYTTTLDFRSWQSPYNSETRQGISGWTFENNAIKYNFKFQY